MTTAGPFARRFAFWKDLATMTTYSPAATEAKWQDVWAEAETFKAERSDD